LVGKYVSSMPFGLSPRDPATLTLTALVLVAIARNGRILARSPGCAR